MKHLIICREYPPAPGGGIGTYALHISRLLAESGETVHVISQLWEGSRQIEEQCRGRLIIHRVAFEDSRFVKPTGAITSVEGRALFETSFYPQSFSWQAGLLAERLIEEEQIDIIEAQEYEAPLYYLQLRRALGLGPKRRPACVVHLHSPTQFIARHNDWDMMSDAVLLAKRLEHYTIASADALLCPSHYLARQAEAYFGLGDGSIRVIPLPIGANPLLKRDEDTWEHGTICYLGRLERRKGVIEWIDAAVSAAYDYPNARFEFVGANVLGTPRISGEEFVNRRIPADLKSRFLFRGEQKRSSLPEFLLGARMAVIPSRWENFPNTCIEAMCSGLPVIVSPEGGMAEMIRDARSGWLAAGTTSQDLAAALRRALDTPAERLAEMGSQAARDIHDLCNNEAIVERHLAFRAQVAEQGASRSLHLPPYLPWDGEAQSEMPARPLLPASAGVGLAVVVTAATDGPALEATLRSIENQTSPPAAVVVLYNGLDEAQMPATIVRARQLGWLVEQPRSDDFVVAKNEVTKTLLRSQPPISGFVFLNSGDQLLPDFIDMGESILRHCPEVGLVSCWARLGDDSIRICPTPAFPYQWVSNEAVGFSAVRAAALSAAGGFRPNLNDGYAIWDLFNTIMAAGWVTVTAPAVLGASQQPALLATAVDSSAHMRMRDVMLERFPELLARDARTLVLLAEASAARIERETASLPIKRQEPFKRLLKRQLIKCLPWKAVRILKRIRQWLRQRTGGRMATFIARLTS